MIEVDHGSWCVCVVNIPINYADMLKDIREFILKSSFL